MQFWFEIEAARGGNVNIDCVHSEELALPLDTSRLVEWSPNDRPCWMGPCCYWLATLLLCKVCFEGMFTATIQPHTYIFKKEYSNLLEDPTFDREEKKRIQNEVDRITAFAQR
jgi:hypothetical protein